MCRHCTVQQDNSARPEMQKPRQMDWFAPGGPLVSTGVHWCGGVQSGSVTLSSLGTFTQTSQAFHTFQDTELDHWTRPSQPVGVFYLGFPTKILRWTQYWTVGWLLAPQCWAVGSAGCPVLVGHSLSTGRGLVRSGHVRLQVR